MIYVGIDVAKQGHFASLISSDGEILVGPFQFSNDGDGVQYLVSAFEPFDDEEIIIGLESTAHYADNLIRCLVAEGYNVCVLNPLSTSSMRKNNIRKTKTDKIDTYIIAQTLMMQKSYRFVTFEDLDLINLKELGRFRQKTIKQRIRLKIQVTSVIAQIELLDEQLARVEAEMTEIMRFNDSVIMTIPGIGYLNGGMILGEIGDIHRFSTPKKLLAFAGLDPSVYQSGNFNARRTRMSKRGSRVLRYALMNAAHNVVKNNATFKAYYDKKMAEGRTHYNALGHCAGKLVRVI